MYKFLQEYLGNFDTPQSIDSDLSLSWTGVFRWSGGRALKYRHSKRRTREINKFLGIIPLIVVFQYKDWLPYTYKIIHFRDIHIH